MVTFEQILVKYIYQQKKLTLQGFGTIVLTANIPDSDLIHKNRHLPVEGISFENDPKAETDDNFISFFSQQRGKIKPLAISDIESHLQLARQLMNIGKPYEIEGLGMFSMDKNSHMVFTPGHFTVPMNDTQATHNRIRERTETQEKIESEERGKGLSAGTRNALIGLVIILVLAVAGWFVWSQYYSQDTPPAAQPGIIDSTGSGANTLPPSGIDSANAVPASSLTLITDSNQVVRWKAYFRYFTDKEKALERLMLYKGTQTHVMLETDDSVNFRMFVVIDSPVSDTARKTDSLRRFYARPVRLERFIP